MVHKILHVLDHSLPIHDGYALRSHNILRAQQRRGWQVVGLTSPKHEASWSAPEEPQVILSGCRYYRSGAVASSPWPFASEGRVMAALARRLRQVIAQEQPTVLHVHSPILNALPVLWATRRLTLPVVYEIRAFWEDAAADQGTYAEGSWKYQLVRAAETWVCRHADHVAVLCQGLREDLLARGLPADKLSVVPNGVNVEEFTTCTPDADYQRLWGLTGKQVIGFIGSFYRYEGLTLLVDAMAQLTTTHPDVVLLLVGGGEMEAALKAQVERLQLTEKVLMPGRIPHTRVPGIYGLIDILAYPRYATRLTELVTPLKPLEAMAMGKALIASDIGGHRELIRHGQTGVLFAPDNVTACVEALSALLRDPAYRQKLAQQGADWVRQEQTWDHTTAVHGDIYAKVLAQRGIRG